MKNNNDETQLKIIGLCVEQQPYGGTSVMCDSMKSNNFIFHKQAVLFLFFFFFHSLSLVRL